MTDTTPYAISTVAPVRVSPTDSFIPRANFDKLAVPLRSDQGTASWVIGGADAASLEVATVAGVQTLRLKNDSTGNGQTLNWTVTPVSLSGVAGVPFAQSAQWSTVTIHGAWATAGAAQTVYPGFGGNNCFQSNGDGTATRTKDGILTNNSPLPVNHRSSHLMVDGHEKFQLMVGFREQDAQGFITATFADGRVIARVQQNGGNSAFIDRYYDQGAGYEHVLAIVDGHVTLSQITHLPFGVTGVTTATDKLLGETMVDPAYFGHVAGLYGGNAGEKIGPLTVAPLALVASSPSASS